MRTVKGYVQTRKLGTRCTFEFEVEDETTPGEVMEHARDAMFELIDWDYTVEPEDPQ